MKTFTALVVAVLVVAATPGAVSPGLVVTPIWRDGQVLVSLSRTIDGRLEDTRQTDDQEAMRPWLTRFDRIPVLLTSALEANGEYDVRVRVHKSPRNAWFPLPWDRSAILGNARFTFLP